MLVAVALAVAFLAALWAIGRVIAQVLSPPEGPLPEGVAPLLGLACVLGLLELFGYGLAVSVVIAGAVPLLVGATALAVRGVRRDGLRATFAGIEHWLAPAALGIAVGVVPLLVAGRLTLAALTNDDATLYITVADRLRDAVFALRELDQPTTLTGLIVASCNERLARLEHELGAPLPSRGGQNLHPGPLGER